MKLEDAILTLDAYFRMAVPQRTNVANAIEVLRNAPDDKEAKRLVSAALASVGEDSE